MIDFSLMRVPDTMASSDPITEDDTGHATPDGDEFSRPLPVDVVRAPRWLRGQLSAMPEIDRDRAQRLAEAAYTLAPDDALILSSGALVLLNQLEEADRRLERALALDPGRRRVLSGFVLGTTGRGGSGRPDWSAG